MESQMVFIAGAPRSGTTAITRMLHAHPDVFLADAKVLGTSSDGKPTYESAIFCRPLTDDEVLDRFAKLDCEQKFILEKTPDHIHFLDRIRHIFPGAKFILMQREALGAVKSWKVAQSTFLKSGGSITDACKNWARSTRIVSNNAMKNDVLVVEFGNLMASREAVAENIFEFLGLDQAFVAHCLIEMDNPAKERVVGVVGESVKGGDTRLSLTERLKIHYYCGSVQRDLAKKR